MDTIGNSPTRRLAARVVCVIPDFAETVCSLGNYKGKIKQTFSYIWVVIPGNRDENRVL